MNVNKKPKKIAIGIVVYISVLLILNFLFVALAYLVFDIKNSYDAKIIFTSLSLISFIISLFVSNFIYHQILQKPNLEELSKFYYGAKTYGEQNNIKMSWFIAYIKVILPFKILFNILFLVLFFGIMYYYKYLATDYDYLATYYLRNNDTFKSLFYILFALVIINLAYLIQYSYRDMKKFKSNGYVSFIGNLIIEFITAVFLFLISVFLFQYKFFYPYKIEVALIPITIYLIIWILPNFIYFKKRKSIFGLCFEIKETETSSISAEELLSNEKIEELWSGIKPETADKMFKMGKEQVSNIIISLSQILNINLKDCDIAQYKSILNIYGKTFIWKTEKKASYESIILSLQKYNKDYINSEEIAKKVFDFCVSDIYITDYKSKADKTTQNLNEAQNLKNNEFNFCNICGNKLDNDYAFCNKCGNKVR